MRSRRTITAKRPWPKVPADLGGNTESLMQYEVRSEEPKKIPCSRTGDPWSERVPHVGRFRRPAFRRMPEWLLPRAGGPIKSSNMQYSTVFPGRNQKNRGPIKKNWGRGAWLSIFFKNWKSQVFFDHFSFFLNKMTTEAHVPQFCWDFPTKRLEDVFFEGTYRLKFLLNSIKSSILCLFRRIFWMLSRFFCHLAGSAYTLDPREPGRYFENRYGSKIARVWVLIFKVFSNLLLKTSMRDHSGGFTPTNAFSAGPCFCCYFGLFNKKHVFSCFLLKSSKNRQKTQGQLILGSRGRRPISVKVSWELSRYAVEYIKKKSQSFSLKIAPFNLFGFFV